ncbi:MAG: hypothetical protein KDJ29_17050, partial [Hyphomicrobiales bacterium]|nr:hypothetical protein [Hyphomicrobiales bacterium]
MPDTLPWMSSPADPVARPLQPEMSSGVRDALSSIGRTEDIRLSPDNRRLAIVGFNENVCLLCAVEIDAKTPVPRIALTGHVELVSDVMRSPHGLEFIDDDTIVIANRGGNVSLFRLPSLAMDGGRIALEPFRVLTRPRVRRHFRQPGSVLFLGRTGNRIDLLVCDIQRNLVSEHRVNLRWPFGLTRNQVRIQTGLLTPDGLALSADGRWLAVSNHETHQVFLYDRNIGIRPSTRPHGMCEDVAFPHGLRFSPDGRSLYVTDAGRPKVHRFDATNGDWSGPRHSAAAATVMDRTAFEKFRYSDREGGP